MEMIVNKPKKSLSFLTANAAAKKGGGTPSCRGASTWHGSQLAFAVLACGTSMPLFSGEIHFAASRFLN